MTTVIDRFPSLLTQLMGGDHLFLAVDPDPAPVHLFTYYYLPPGVAPRNGVAIPEYVNDFETSIDWI